MQYTTSFNCPDSGEHTVQTEVELHSEKDLVNAECTNCGYALTADDIASQGHKLTNADIPKMLR